MLSLEPLASASSTSIRAKISAIDLPSDEDHYAADVVVGTIGKRLLNEHSCQDLRHRPTLSLELPSNGCQLTHTLHDKLYGLLVADDIPHAVAGQDDKGVLW